MKNHYRKLEEMYLKANINSSVFDSSTILIKEGEAKISLNVSEKYFHALGAIRVCLFQLQMMQHFSVSSIVKDYFILTTSFQINILRPVKRGKIHAIGKVKFTSKKLFTAQSSLFNEHGVEVAETGNFVLSKSELTKNIGY